MRLIDRNHTPVGGFFFVVPETGDRVGTDGNFDKLIDSVFGYYDLKKIEPPEYLVALIEDQICTRQPPNRCRYGKGLGDRISNVIHKGAGLIDKALGTNLEQKARRCGGCGKRRTKLNQLSKSSNR